MDASTTPITNIEFEKIETENRLPHNWMNFPLCLYRNHAASATPCVHDADRLWSTCTDLTTYFLVSEWFFSGRLKTELRIWQGVVPQCFCEITKYGNIILNRAHSPDILRLQDSGCFISCKPRSGWSEWITLLWLYSLLWSLGNQNITNAVFLI